MLKQNARLVDLGLRLTDLIVLTLTLPLAHWGYSVAPMARAVAPPLAELWGPFVGVLLLWIAISGSFQVYGAYRTRRISWEIFRIARSMGLLALLVLAGIFVATDSRLPRIFVGLYFLGAFAMMAASRLVLRVAARLLRRRGYNVRRYAIVGVGIGAEEIATIFERQPQWGYRLAGYILPDGNEFVLPGETILGTLDELDRILDQHVLDEVVFAVPRDRLPLMADAIHTCEEQGVRVVVSLQPLQLGTGRMSLLELSGLSMLVFDRTPSDPIALAAKRAFDVVVSAIALVALSPLFVAVAAAIKLDSKGPVFFRQTRVGLNGRPFSMVKFRSMYQDAEARLQALRDQNEMSGPVFKMKNDPRITRVGRIIRKLSIDELPQFWNVLTGTMSIVGPRPPLPAEVRQYERWQRRRLSVRPGITCTWQVSGRNSIPFDRWMELDLEYIDNWSLQQDLKIFLKTIPAVVSTRGAR
ncbi:MAG TPA: sugar transferase [Vulgatibacter sp.]|nr:sugar transferase [Vulgatibacter sp.]